MDRLSKAGTTGTNLACGSKSALTRRLKPCRWPRRHRQHKMAARRSFKLARGLEYAPALLSLCMVLQPAARTSSGEKQPERPHITGIDHVSVYVSDLEKSRQFYSAVLGLTTNCPHYTGSDPC